VKHYLHFTAVVLISLCACGCSIVFSAIPVSLPDLSGKPDGVYRGEYNTHTPVQVVIMDVTVQNQRIQKIDIVQHICSAFGKPAEKIIGKIIEKQSLDVDTVSGATISSKGILKAVENALQ
jgi:uncharacterized protein with FMN-binding domain